MTNFMIVLVEQYSVIEIWKVCRKEIQSILDFGLLSELLSAWSLSSI